MHAWPAEDRHMRAWQVDVTELAKRYVMVRESLDELNLQHMRRFGFVVLSTWRMGVELAVVACPAVFCLQASTHGLVAHWRGSHRAPQQGALARAFTFKIPVQRGCPVRFVPVACAFEHFFCCYAPSLQLAADMPPDWIKAISGESAPSVNGGSGEQR
eukprot:3122404-Pleurochrysis_carterae.AAC.1